MFQIKVEKLMKKDIQSVFNILSDHENYKKFPGVTQSILLNNGDEEKNGVGALRKINLGSILFVERIIQFESPFIISYQIEESFPLPIHHERGEIILKEKDGGTHITWTSEGKVKIPLIGFFIFDKLIEKRGETFFKKTLDFINNIDISNS